jgi:hypothetical protein
MHRNERKLVTGASFFGKGEKMSILRIRRVSEHLNQRGEKEALLITKLENAYYLTGWNGHSDYDVVLFLTSSRQYLITNILYEEELSPVARDMGMTLKVGRLTEVIKEIAEREGITMIEFEADHVTYVIAERFESILTGCELRSLNRFG